MVVVVYMTNGDVVVCSGIETCPVTSLVVLKNPQGITDTIYPAATTISLSVRRERIIQIYTGQANST